jgi:hypothetical protein
MPVLECALDSAVAKFRTGAPRTADIFFAKK